MLMGKLWVDPTLYTSRPKDGRLPRETAVYDLLDRLGVGYVRIDHEPTARIEDCAAEVGGILGIEICKNLFLCNRQKTDFYLLLMPGGKEFRTKDLSAQIGSSRLSFAPPEYMEELLHTAPGSASVLGLMNDRGGRVRLLIDRDAVKAEFFGCHPCANTSSLKLRTADLLEKILPAVGHEPTFVSL